MTCAPTIVVTSDEFEIVVPAGGVNVSANAVPVTLALSSSSVEIVIPSDEPAVIDVGPRGPPGPEGPPGTPDYVWQIKPDSVLTYRDGGNGIARVDYVDGQFKEFAYDDDDRVISVSGLNSDGDTVTKTFTYDVDDLLVAVETVVS